MSIHNVSSVHFEKFATANGDVVRLIAFETNEDTGARSVYDIFEADVDADGIGIVRLANLASNSYPNLDEAAITFGNYYDVEDERNDIGQFDLGRARTLKSKLIRAITQMEAKEI